MSTPTTHRYARAEVVGYPEPVLEAVRDLMAEIQADPQLALGSGQMMVASKDLFAVEREGRQSDLMGAIARLVIAAAAEKHAEGSDVAEGSR